MSFLLTIRSCLSKYLDLNSLEEKELLNELFHRSSGGRRIVKRGLGKQTAGRQISHEVLCEYWSKALESKLGRNVNPPEFPAGDEVLRNLWRQIPIEDEEVPVITTEQTRQAVYNLSNGTSPGYDGLTAEIWKMCDHTALCKYLKRLLQYVICVGYVPAKWKIGIVTFLPKPDKPDAEYANPKA